MQSSIENITLKRKPRAVSTFLKKTYDLLNDVQNFTCVKWAPNGIGFIITDQQLFSKTVLPKYFKHNNYSSFVRQLNMYNFHKIRQSNSQSYFHHEYFDRDNRNLMSQIKRKPQKKKRKSQNQSDDSINENQNIQIQKNIKNKYSQTEFIKKENKKQNKVQVSINFINQVDLNKSQQNVEKISQHNTTRNLFSQTFNPCCQVAICPSRFQNSNSQRNIQMIEDDDKLSINDQITQKIPRFNAQQLFCASNNNLFQFIGNFQPSNFAIFY